MRIALARGRGVLLEETRRPFHDVAVRAGRRGRRRSAGWRRPGPTRASLDVGELVLEPAFGSDSMPGGFDRHTFLCGQSGSGKTYALGTMLEQLLLETTLRIVVLDPNSDFVRLQQVRDGVEEDAASRYRGAVAELVVRSGGQDGAERLHVRFTDCDGEEQAAVLRLDPIRDRDEYGALVDLLETGFERSAATARELADRLLGHRKPGRSGARRHVSRNLGIRPVARLVDGDEGSLQDLVAPGGPRALVVDLGSLGTRGEKAIAAESVLAALWRRRAEREPVLVVIDEAHNVCPREPDDASDGAGDGVRRSHRRRGAEVRARTCSSRPSGRIA